MSDERTNMTRAQARVAKGAMLVEREFGPRWREDVNVLALNMNNILDCVLGQLAGSYEDGLAKLGIIEGDAWMFGFDTRDDRMESLFALHDAWVSVLALDEGNNT